MSRLSIAILVMKMCFQTLEFQGDENSNNDVSTQE